VHAWLASVELDRAKLSRFDLGALTWLNAASFQRFSGRDEMADLCGLDGNPAWPVHRGISHSR
jgi:hypothetical protein